MNKWLFPLNLKVLGTTTDKKSFDNIDFRKEVEIPIPKHEGAFGTHGQFFVHKGVDLYCLPGTKVFTVEEGQIIDIRPWTGSGTEYESFNKSYGVLVEGASGIISYAEIRPLESLKLNTIIEAGSLLGSVIQTVNDPKIKPKSMLHLQMYNFGTKKSGAWINGEYCPPGLVDPTPYLLESIS